MSWKRKRELTKAQITMDVKQHSLVAVSKASMFVQTCLYKLKNEIFLLPVGLPYQVGFNVKNGIKNFGTEGAYQISAEQ